MAHSHIITSFYNPGSNTSADVPLTVPAAGVAVGEMAFLGCLGTFGSIASITDSKSNTWTAGPAIDISGNSHTSSWYCIPTTALVSGDTITIHPDSAWKIAMIHVSKLSGQLTGASPLDGTFSGTSSNPGTLSYTATSGATDDWAWCFCAQTVNFINPTTLSVSSGWTIGAQQSQTADGGVHWGSSAISYRQAAASSFSNVNTWDAAGNVGMLGILLKAAAVAAGPTHVKTVEGVALASVKKVSGLAIASDKTILGLN